MPQNERTYIAIDLKSYYASVECMERGLDPMQTNLVVADPSRTEKTICLAVSPALNAYGIPGRARLFEVVERVRQVNAERQRRAPGGRLTGKSADDLALKADASLAVDYLVAPPRMAKYIEVSMQIYGIYLKYVSPEDIHTYSIDEVLMDVTGYLEPYRTTARELARAMILDVLHTTGITATAGIGSNLYLCKVAMDMMAKRVPPDENGVRIAQLDERSYRALLWEHRPLTDFWRVGRGYAKKLEEHGLYTMGDVARCSIGKPNEYYNEGLLYKLFGVNAELLIDHAWGWEPCRMADIKAYRPETNSISSGQVLQCPYPYDKARLVVREMAEAVALELLEKVGLADKANAYPAQRSGGQKQRVAIARVLANEPEVILCDEATSALDPETTQTILKLLKSIRDTLGITIVVITHEMRVIQQVCTRVAVLDGGLVQEEGSVADIFAHPASRAAKRLLLIEDEEEESYAG